MKTRNIVTCVGALCACLAIASPAGAKDNCSGHTIGVGNARVVIHDDGEGRSITAGSYLFRTA